jgi:hypothetical protein
MENPEAKLVYIGKQLDSLQPGINAEETFFIMVPAGSIKKRKQVYKLNIMSGNDVVDTRKITFIGTY